VKFARFLCAMKRRLRGGQMHLIREIKVLTVREPAPVVHADSPEDCTKFWHDTIATAPWFDPCKEHVVALLLNAQHDLFAYNLVSIGCLNASIAHPREILRPAIAASAFGFVLIHNHPSSDAPRPSSPDRMVTTQIRKASYILQMHFVDHVIVGCEGNSYFSFREHARRWC
jgi:DNA repair protein RadC